MLRNTANSGKLETGEAGNTTVTGTKQYFTLVQQRYKHGGHVARFLSGKEKRD